MIKTDYKPNGTNKSIFSSSRKRSSFPVIIMAMGALLLAVWGLWAELNDQPSSQDDQMPLSTTNSSLEEITTLDHSNTETKSNLQEIPLEFQHENKSTPTIRPKDTNKSKAKTKQVDNKPTKKIPQVTQASQTTQKDDINWQQTKIRSGDSMARLFQRLGFSATDLHKIISIGKKTSVLKRIKPGKKLGYLKDTAKKLTAIQYSIDRLKTLTVTKTDNQWFAKIEIKDVEIRQANARGTIDSSLFLAGKQAGLTDSMVMELAGIFGWDIDFILDIRKGDQFTAIFEEKFVVGEKIGNGNILAAEFINQGKSFKAVLYTDSSGHSEYYTPRGLSMRKAFLRAPVDFSYISSSFKPRRFHPILKRVQAHNGVDYRAPKGTPVKASGDGKVIVSAYSKYNGHHVFVQHGQKYVTKYLHFTKRKVRRGQRVKQGQIIGYVGATGLAEAPHLHYEFLVNGVHRNPRTIKLPDADPINKKEKMRFITETKELVQQLETQSQIYNEKYKNAD
ncbi:MAG: murein DD-endopeptidase MepM/ murein hydrolase activator NlpD [Enterobacterales bacterium]|jgi:murein DD-endopeptidase MepM/ murein hydrolase activator NlpD